MPSKTRFSPGERVYSKFKNSILIEGVANGKIRDSPRRRDPS